GPAAETPAPRAWRSPQAGGGQPMSTGSMTLAFDSPPVVGAIFQKHSMFPQLHPFTPAATPVAHPRTRPPKFTGGFTPQPALGSGARKVTPARSVRTYISQPGYRPRLCVRLTHVIRCAPRANA